MNAIKFYSLLVFLAWLSIGGVASQLQAHRAYVHNDISVHIGSNWGSHPNWYHNRVYYTDPWYHPHHVYIYQGDPYAVYYYGNPYYYYDPRYYYF